MDRCSVKTCTLAPSWRFQRDDGEVKLSCAGHRRWIFGRMIQGRANVELNVKKTA